MAKRPPQDTDQSRELIREYVGNFNSYIVFRLFAGAYQNSTRYEYLEAVAALCKNWEAVMKQTVTVEINRVAQMPGVDVERYRIDRYEAIAQVKEYVQQYLVALNPTPPPAAPETTPAPETEQPKA